MSDTVETTNSEGDAERIRIRLKGNQDDETLTIAGDLREGDAELFERLRVDPILAVRRQQHAAGRGGWRGSAVD